MNQLNFLKQLMGITLATFVVLQFQACSPVTFSKNDDSQVGEGGDGGPGAGPTTPTSEDPGNTGSGGDGTPPPPAECIPNVESITIPTKIMFVVDTSGSNAYTSTFMVGGNMTTVAPTDPHKTFRTTAINNFLNKYGHKDNFQWSFVTFAQPDNQTNFAHALINSGNDQSPVFSADPNKLTDALTQFNAVADLGITPYYSAMNMAIKAIQEDPDLNSDKKPQYFVIMLTDGMPTDKYNSKDASLLTSIAPGRVRLSAIFYTSLSDGSFAEQFLKAVTTTGGGVFVSAKNSDTGTMIQIDDVIPGAGKNCK